MTFPAISLLRKQFKNAQIDIAARPWVCPVYRCHDAVNNVLELNSEKGFKRYHSLFNNAQLIKKLNYNSAVIFPNSFESALLFKLSAVPNIVGYNTDLRGLLLTKPIPLPHNKTITHEVYYYTNLIKEAFSINAQHFKELDLKLTIPENVLKNIETILEKLGITNEHIIIGINPGAAYGPAKCWPVEKYKKLAKRLLNINQNIRLIVFGTENEFQIGEEIKGANPKKILNLCGKTTLLEAMSAISMLDLMVTNDSGLMHIAAACKIPIVAIFGSTNPITTGPWSKDALIIRKELSCSPCLKRECSKGFECMLSIKVEEVFNACHLQLHKKL